MPIEGLPLQAEGSIVGGGLLSVDLVIPVYNEGENILAVLASIEASVATPARVFICYDFEGDNTLTAIRDHWNGKLPIEFVRNPTRGAHSAVMTGLRHGSAPYAIMFPADDDYNAGILDAMVAKATEGAEIVCASRFMRGGSMVGCPWLKAVLVRTAAITLRVLAKRSDPRPHQRLPAVSRVG